MPTTEQAVDLPIPATAVESSARGGLYYSTVVAALGGLLFGFATAVISGTTGDLQAFFGLSEGMLGFIVVTALLGTMLGSVAVGRPADAWGRRRSSRHRPGLCFHAFAACMLLQTLFVGHGNYDTCDNKTPNCFFLLKAKCRVVATDLGIAISDSVFVNVNS